MPAHRPNAPKRSTNALKVRRNAYFSNFDQHWNAFFYFLVFFRFLRCWNSICWNFLSTRWDIKMTKREQIWFIVIRNRCFSRPTSWNVTPECRNDTKSGRLVWSYRTFFHFSALPSAHAHHHIPNPPNPSRLAVYRGLCGSDCGAPL